MPERRRHYRVLTERLASGLAKSEGTSPVEDIEDSIQHAFEKLFGAVKEIRDEEAWLFSVAMHYLVRAKWRRTRLTPIGNDLEANENEPIVYRDELEIALRRMFPSDESYMVIRHLHDHEPEEFATAILHFERGRTFDSLAEALTKSGEHVTGNALQKRFKKALRKAAQAVGLSPPPQTSEEKVNPNKISYGMRLF